MTNTDQSDLICPYHKRKLVLREAKQGRNIGTKFWGCPTFFETGCTYTEPIEKKKSFVKESEWLKYKNDFQNAGLGRRIWLILKIIMLTPIYIVGLGVLSVFEAYRAKYK